MPLFFSDEFPALLCKRMALLPANKNAPIPFKDHPDLPALIDILSRRTTHHALLQTDYTDKMQSLFLEAFSQYLLQDTVPVGLRESAFIYLKTESIDFDTANRATIEEAFRLLHENLQQSENSVIFFLPSLSSMMKNAFLQAQLYRLVCHPQCRLFTFHQGSIDLPHLSDLFSTIQLAGITESDTKLLLTRYRAELEAYHGVFIPLELPNQAYSLAKHYLSHTNALEKALLLLDSSAARTTAQPGEVRDISKPIVTYATLMEVLSTWTHIPTSHLRLNQFDTTDFNKTLQQNIAGQDAALHVIGQSLQQAYTKLEENKGPFCTLLFAGPMQSGKYTTAIALTKYLYHRQDVLYTISLLPSQTSLMDLKLQVNANQDPVSLQTLLQKTPYAVIVIENVEQASAALLTELQQMISTGCLHDTNGHRYDFHQAILILCTHFTETQLTSLAPAFLEEQHRPIDLMQLVHHNPRESASAANTTTYALMDSYKTIVEEKLSSSLSQYCTLVPFLPLKKSAVEKIIRNYCVTVATLLQTRDQIDLCYTPEIIRFLCQEAIKTEDNGLEMIDIKAAQYYLYNIIARTVLSQQENKHRPLQFTLKLNETGHTLSCHIDHPAPRELASAQAP
ncbi:MAG TPA: AAA family ATPase [Gammaproteobacteria bacterium]|jgi:ATP-dependent Clp protease ATP-binding subunit ClpA|nr:AAA family ATPase [Gammaproteobacteria bacterium]